MKRVFDFEELGKVRNILLKYGYDIRLKISDQGDELSLIEVE